MAQDEAPWAEGNKECVKPNDERMAKPEGTAHENFAALLLCGISVDDGF